MLSPEEYVAFKAVADDRGQSGSGLARQLIREEIHTFAKSAHDEGDEGTDEVVPNKAKP